VPQTFGLLSICWLSFGFEIAPDDGEPMPAELVLKSRSNFV
jgi:hypothetical protein